MKRKLIESNWIFPFVLTLHSSILKLVSFSSSSTKRFLRIRNAAVTLIVKNEEGNYHGPRFYTN